MDVGSGQQTKIPESDRVKKSIVLKKVPNSDQAECSDNRVLKWPVTSWSSVRRRDWQCLSVTRPADQKKIGDRRFESGFFKCQKSFVKKIREALIRVGKANDRMKVGCTEIGIDKKGFEPLPS